MIEQNFAEEEAKDADEEDALIFLTCLLLLYKILCLVTSIFQQLRFNFKLFKLALRSTWNIATESGKKHLRKIKMRKMWNMQ